MGIDAAAKKALQDGLRDLTVATYARIDEMARQTLHTRRSLYMEHLSPPIQVSDDCWLISLGVKSFWIEDGVRAGSMLPALLASPKAKRAKDGSTYLVIPFVHGGGKTQNTPAQMNLIDTIRSELKSRKIPYKSIERNPDGSAKLGRLHSFNIMNAPLKTANGPGQGHGPIGQVRQGKTGIPFLRGVGVYQKEVTDKAGKTSTKREIVTFRVASSKQIGTGKWDHPGLVGVHLMDKALVWAREEWERNMGPKVVSNLIAELG